MARSRNIKPGFFKSDKLAELEPLGRILFAGLWCIADREGRLEDRPKRIKAEVLPYDDCDVPGLLQDLHDHGLILRYKVAGAQYIQILSFAKHQNPHKNEAPSAIPAPVPEHSGPSTVQAPENSEPGAVPAPDKHPTNRADSLNLIPDSFNRIPDSLKGEGGGEPPTPLPGTNPEPQKPEKVPYAEFVSLTKNEHQKLIDSYGSEAAARLIEILNNYKAAQGKQYKSDYHAIKNWVVSRLEEEKAKAVKIRGPDGHIPRAYASLEQWAGGDEG